ncbi:porin [Roseateles violae]|uniref:Porin n=1 Tax=Roseateles violae TaxID=3058042 RepID=A0ABT8DZ90_9BURK|nr:porin [Pelomonas sp. PFR6]MDN3922920.1 porin [Pelomonas sp. PFR6]
MKKIAALALLAGVSALAQAQTQITLFGVVDVAARHTKNGDESQTSLASGGAEKSRLGIRGTEQLSGGLKASFWLEGGLNADTGSSSDSSRFWNRRSTVSLHGGFGEVRLGRDATPTYSGYASYDVFGASGVGDASKFVSKLGTDVDTLERADNLVSYLLPADSAGFYGQVSAAAGEGAAGKKYYGGRLGFARGALDVSASYGETTVSPLAGSKDDKYKLGSLAASYDLRVAKLSGYVSQAKYADTKLSIANLGASVPVGPGSARLSYTYVDASGRTAAGLNTEDNDSGQLAVGYVYDLSKRTSLYSTVAYIDNRHGASYVVDSKPALLSSNTGKNSTGYEFGIRHSF